MKRSAPSSHSPPHKHIALDSPAHSFDTSPSPTPTPTVHSSSPLSSSTAEENETQGSHELGVQLSTLPIDVLEHMSMFLDVADLLDLSTVSQLFAKIVEKRFMLKFSEEWKSGNNFEHEGSWKVQYQSWSSDFSQRKHGLPKLAWCVENGADRKLHALLHSPPPHRKRMLRLLNPPTMLHSPLHYACTVGCVEVVAIILSFDCAKECLNKHALGVSCQGISAFWTPLHYAISYRHAEIVKLLIRHGADVHTEKGIMSPLQFGQLCGGAAIKKILASVGK